MKLIDLSVALETGIASDPPGMEPQIQYMNHRQTPAQMTGFFPGMTEQDLPDGDGWAVETMTVSTHNGTHLDAPYHHHSTMDRALVPGGRPAITIDQVPLEWCFQPGVKLDFRHVPDGHVVTPDQVEAELARIGHTLSPLEIVVINTSAGAAYGQPDYIDKGCGMGKAATLYLLERGVRVTGTDGWSWDAPFSFTRARYAADRDASIIWEGHRASMEIGYSHMEKLANLDQLPATGFRIACFPFKIKGASAGYVRAVAIMDA